MLAESKEDAMLVLCVVEIFSVSAELNASNSVELAIDDLRDIEKRYGLETFNRATNAVMALPMALTETQPKLTSKTSKSLS